MQTFEPSSDIESLEDESCFSLMALFGFLASLVGTFTFLHVMLIPFAIMALGMGMVATLMQKKWNISKVSRLLAFLALAIGTFSTGWGATRHWLDQGMKKSFARSAAEKYLKLLAAGDIDSAFRLSKSQAELMGDQPDVASMINTFNASRKHVDEFAKQFAIAEVIRRGSKAKWEYVSLRSVYQTNNGTNYLMVFRDRTAPNAKKLWVRAVRENPRRTVPYEYPWYIVECDWER
ncbi:MAG: hypothetical protein U0905_12620 [Pirellulales bacterium]